METHDYQNFVASLLQNGFHYTPGEQKKLYDTAKFCARTAGITMAGVTMHLGSPIPVVGHAATALVGFLGGTFTCTLVDRLVIKKALDEIVK